MAIVRQGVAVLEKKVVNSTGMFRYTILEDSPDLKLFSQPLALTKLARFLLDAYRVRRLVDQLLFFISGVCC